MSKSIPKPAITNPGAQDHLIARMHKINALLDNSWGLRNPNSRQNIIIQLGGLKKIKAWNTQKDGREMRLPEWQYGKEAGMLRLVQLFRSTGDYSLRWKYKHRQFDAEGWLNTTHEEMRKWFICGERQLTSFISQLRKAGVLETWYKWDKGIRHWWIRLNPWQLETLMQSAKINAVKWGWGQVNQTGSKATKGAKLNDMHVDINNSISTAGVVVVDKENKEMKAVKNIASPGDANSNPPPLPATDTTIAPETLRVVEQLKEVIPHAEFTSPAIKQLNRLVTKLLPAKRLTEQLARHYVRIFCSDSGGDCRELNTQDLQEFIKYWDKIRQRLHTAIYRDAAAVAQSELCWQRDAAHQLEVLYGQAEDYVELIDLRTPAYADKTAVDKLRDPWAQHTMKNRSSIIVWMAAGIMGVNPRIAFPGRENELRNALRMDPSVYAALREKVPLDYWGQISERESAHLIQMANGQHWDTACTASLVPASKIE